MRQEQGTWLGVTKQGRIAVLTNFREEGVIIQEVRSRGAIVNSFLTQPAGSNQDTEAFIRNLTDGEGLKGVGGFTLVCGSIGQPLGVISNRTPNVEGTTWILKDIGETIGLSNAAFANRSWPKVIRGEKLLSDVIKENVTQQSSRSALIEAMFQILSDDKLPMRSKGMGWDAYLKELRKSIFIPVIGGEGADDLSAEDLAAAKSGQHVNVEHDAKYAGKGDGLSGVYGTQKQTVVLVDHQGKVTFVERSLYGENGSAVSASERDRVSEFDIEGWDKPKEYGSR